MRAYVPATLPEVLRWYAGGAVPVGTRINAVTSSLRKQHPDADDEELTRTGKVRRRFVYGLYIKLIEAMYRDQWEVEVKAKVQYRDGQVGKVETKVKIIPV